MTRRSKRQRPASGTLALVRCAWCGPEELPLERVQITARSPREGLFEFRCPSCERLNIRALEPADLSTLVEVGVSPGRGPAPFELLEEHRGPPITWDDLIDFHDAVARVDTVPWRARSERRRRLKAERPRADQERDAA
jgi:hypothetical protein